MTRRINAILLVMLMCLACPAVFAQSPLTESVDTTLLGISEIFKDNFDSSQTLGKPVSAGDYVIIPVVVKFAGFGFGTKLEAKDKENRKEQAGKVENKHADRIGLGGGAFIRPVALIVVKNGGDFQLIKLNEGFMATLAKNMAPAIANVLKETVKNVFKMKRKQAKKAARRKNKKEKALIKKKKNAGFPQHFRPGPYFMPGPHGAPGPQSMPGPRGHVPSQP